jgi:hypothetical protein
MYIDIDIAYEEVRERERRWDRAMGFEFPDRIPVLHYLGARYWLPLLDMDITFRDYLNDPKTMLEAQLRAGKWIMENVDSDYHKIVCYPDFMWVEDVESFGARIEYPVDDSPWVARPHLLQEDDDLEKLRAVDYVHEGIHGKMIEYYRKMKEMAADYRVRFSDGGEIEATELVYMGSGGIIGPMVLTRDLLSVKQLSLDFFDRPDYLKELLDIIVNKAIQWIDKCQEVSGGRTAFASDYHEGYVFVGDDGTAQMSPKFVEEFALEPTRKLADHIRSRRLKVMAHNCGKADHLLQYWAEQIKVERYVGFSYLTDKQRLKETMGGIITLIGGVDTANLHDGTPDSVREDVRRNIEVFRDVPGYVLMDGHNVAPGTPPENLNAVTQAARDLGTYE